MKLIRNVSTEYCLLQPTNAANWKNSLSHISYQKKTLFPTFHTKKNSLCHIQLKSISICYTFSYEECHTIKLTAVRLAFKWSCPHGSFFLDYISWHVRQQSKNICPVRSYSIGFTHKHLII